MLTLKNLKNKLYLYRIINIFIVLLSASALLFLQNNYLKKIKHLDQELSKTELEKDLQQEEPKLNILKKVPSFGFNNLYSDWIFLNFVQYFGDDPARKLTNYNLSPEYFEIILGQDPRFLQAYLYLSVSCSMYAGMPEKTVALMAEKLKLLSPKVPPKAYYIWRYKAIDELLFLGDGNSAKESFSKASEWASLYNDEEGQFVSKISAQTAQFLETNPNSKSAQVSAWSMVLNSVYDQETRQRAIKAIENLGGKVKLSPEGIVESITLPEKD